MQRDPLFEKSIFLQTLAGKPHSPPPIWLMRQAGRYLPEYRAVRADAGGFLNLVYNPKLACEVTLQPIRRFGFDAAILFSDILVIPHALGRDVRFEVGEGPRLDPILTEKEIADLRVDQVEHFLQPVFEAVDLISSTLPSETALIGFCGAPWTVATYMLAGRGGDEQEVAKKIAYTQPSFLKKLIDVLVEASIIYLNAQVKAGANALQIFDSWAGSLDSKAFTEFVIEPNQRIVDGVRKQNPHIPIIGFPRGAGSLLEKFIEQTHVTAVGLDWSQDLKICSDKIKIPFQGNLDPLRLYASHEEISACVREIKNTVAGKPYIFNLGHGITQHTPIENVEHLIKELRS